MIRRRYFLLASGAVLATAVASQLRRPTPLRLLARRRVTAPSGNVETRAVEEMIEWRADQTALIICAMWDDHYCRNSARRLVEMIPQLNRTVEAARARGVHIIQAPSSTMDFYEDTAQHRRMIGAPHAEPPVPIAKWCCLDPKVEAALPIEDEDPCDDEFGRERKRMYSRQHANIVIAPEDGISDSGQEIYNFCESEGIRNIIMAGVHTNKCVLGRPFGIRQQIRLGRNVVLARDLTDSMYDPRDKPYVSHAPWNRTRHRAHRTLLVPHDPQPRDLLATS